MAAISVPFGPRYLLPGVLIIFSTSSAFRIHVRKCYEQSKTPSYQHPKRWNYPGSVIRKLSTKSRENIIKVHVQPKLPTADTLETRTNMPA